MRWLHHRSCRASALALAGLVGALAFSAHRAGAADGPPKTPTPAPAAQMSTEELLRNLHCMEQRVKQLETMLPQKVATAPAAPENASLPAVVADTQPAEPMQLPPTQSRPQGPTPNRVKTTIVNKTAAAAAPADPCAPAAAPGAAPAKDLFALRPPAQTAPGKDIFSITPPGAAGPVPATGDKALFGIADSPIDGLKIGSYGEMKFGRHQNPAANGQWQSGFDAHRFVLSPTYQITKNIIFNAEIEFEHAGSGFDADDKLHGTAEIEQLYIDFKMIEQFNFRAPGIDLVPIGYINEHHEPNQFYSVKRPELYLGIIPSTWRQPGTRFYGLIGHGFSYDVQISQSIEDFGSGFSNRTGANRVADGPYDGGFSGKEALGLSRTPVGDFRQLNNQMAYTGRLEYQPPWLPGFAGSGSIYYTGNTTPRGAHTDAGQWTDPDHLGAGGEQHLRLDHRRPALSVPGQQCA